ncbi:unnamed protein product [Spirodela intermedia]|uniref:Uncharacterized protein n=1 Tax=Spirodela intermedia TaxID=51605 RepID=A0A7I8KAQ9_SPIIN|nr:unnamed protein product [Spirodela intermedia]
MKFRSIVSTPQENPPLTRTTWPLIHWPASEARKPTTGAMSSVSPRRPRGTKSTALFTSSSLFPAKNISVATAPGATQFAVIPVPRSSFASTFVIASTAAFDAAYAANLGNSDPTTEEEMLMILPPPPRTSRFAASRQHRKTPFAFTAKVASQSSSGVAASGGYLGSSTPADETRIWAAPPKAASAASNRAFTSTALETSARTAIARDGDGDAVISAARSSAWAALAA